MASNSNLRVDFGNDMSMFDEGVAHVCTFFNVSCLEGVSIRGTSEKDQKPFRVWYANLQEIKSLLTRKTGFMMFTATASRATKQKIFDLLGLDRKKKFFNIKLGDDIYAEKIRKPSMRIIEMFHAGSADSVKKHILTELKKEDSRLQIIVCTIAFGMGIDCVGCKKGDMTFKLTECIEDKTYSEQQTRTVTKEQAEELESRLKEHAQMLLKNARGIVSYPNAINEHQLTDVEMDEVWNDVLNDSSLHSIDVNSTAGQEAIEMAMDVMDESGKKDDSLNTLLGPLLSSCGKPT
eukprot:gene1819-2042_t